MVLKTKIKINEIEITFFDQLRKLQLFNILLSSPTVEYPSPTLYFLSRRPLSLEPQANIDSFYRDLSPSFSIMLRCFPQDIQLYSTKYNIVYSIVDVFHKISNYIPPNTILYTLQQKFSTRYPIIFHQVQYCIQELVLFQFLFNKIEHVQGNKQERIELIYSGRFVYRFIFYSEGFRQRLFFNMAAE